MSIRKIALILIGTIAGSFIIYNLKISVDKDASYSYKLPKKMKQVEFFNYSDKDYYKNIKIENNLSLPVIKNNEVLVKIYYAALTNLDFNRKNFLKKNGNFIPCSDFSGKIVQVGENVKNFEIGEKVFGLSSESGMCAEYVAILQEKINRLPFSLTLKQAAAVPTPAIYASYVNLLLPKNSKKKILIDNVISETGTILTDLLIKNKNLEISLIDNKSVQGWISNRNAKEIFTYEEIDKKLKEFGNHFDILIDLKGGKNYDVLCKFLKKNGIFISENNDIDLNKFKKNCSSIKLINMKFIDNKKIFNRIAEMIDDGKVTIAIDKIYKFDNFREYFMRAEKGNTDGKLLLEIAKE